MSKDNTQQVKASRSTTSQDARLFRHNKHISTQLPALPTNSDEYEWETVSERASDSTVSQEDRRRQSWVVNLRGKGYTLRQITKMTGISAGWIHEWMELDVAFRAAVERAREDWLDHEVESLIPLAKRTMSRRKVRTNKAGQKMYDRAEQEAVRLVADTVMKIAGKTNPEKWGGVEVDTSTQVLLQINIPPKTPHLEGELGEWSSDAAGVAARKAAEQFAASGRRQREALHAPGANGAEGPQAPAPDADSSLPSDAPSTADSNP